MAQTFGKRRERDDEFQIVCGGRIEPEEREEKIHRSERRTVAGVREHISLRVEDIRYSKIKFTVYNSSVVGRILKGGTDRDTNEEQKDILNTEIGFVCDLSGFQIEDSNKTLSLTLDIEKRKFTASHRDRRK